MKNQKGQKQNCILIQVSRSQINAKSTRLRMVTDNQSDYSTFNRDKRKKLGVMNWWEESNHGYNKTFLSHKISPEIPSTRLKNLSTQIHSDVQQILHKSLWIKNKKTPNNLFTGYKQFSRNLCMNKLRLNKVFFPCTHGETDKWYRDRKKEYLCD